MTALDLLLYEIDNGTFQLDACLDGLQDDQADEKLSPDGMTIRQMLPHLAEACVAMVEANDGISHKWGSYQPSSLDLQSLRDDLKDKRQAAKEALKRKADDGNCLKHGFDYLVAHDCYHIGQLALIRLKVDPSWNADSIYG